MLLYFIFRFVPFSSLSLSLFFFTRSTIFRALSVRRTIMNDYLADDFETVCSSLFITHTHTHTHTHTYNYRLLLLARRSESPLVQRERENGCRGGLGWRSCGGSCQLIHSLIDRRIVENSRTRLELLPTDISFFCFLQTYCQSRIQKIDSPQTPPFSVAFAWNSIIEMLTLERSSRNPSFPNWISHCSPSIREQARGKDKKISCRLFTRSRGISSRELSRIPCSLKYVRGRKQREKKLEGIFRLSNETSCLLVEHVSRQILITLAPLRLIIERSIYDYIIVNLRLMINRWLIIFLPWYVLQFL